MYHLRYDTAFQYAEDYDLYCRCSSFMAMDNYPECLVQYRIHPESVSQKYKQQQVIDAKTALYLHLRRLRVPFSLKDFISMYGMKKIIYLAKTFLRRIAYNTETFYWKEVRQYDIYHYYLLYRA